MSLICCSQCERVLKQNREDEPIALPAGVVECPDCGPTSRVIKPPPYLAAGQSSGKLVAHKSATRLDADFAAASDAAALSERAVVEKRRANTEGIRIGGSRGESVTIDMDETGSTQSHVQATAPQNEEGSLAVARVLVERLNQLGASWGEPLDVSSGSSRQERGIDCEARDRARVLRIQVTRAVDHTFWAPLGRNGQVFESAASPHELADRLKSAIERKKSLAGRSDIVLALDAQLAGMQALELVVNAFRSAHGEWARSVGYEAIWVVGPTAGLTSRLDV